MDSEKFDRKDKDKKTLLGNPDLSFTGRDNAALRPEITLHNSFPNYDHWNLRERTEKLHEQFLFMQDILHQQYQLENVQPFGIPATNETTTFIGRVIKNEAEDANENLLYLLNTDENSNGVVRISVSLEDVKEDVCLFEGAVIAIEGIVESSTMFNAYKVLVPKVEIPPMVPYHGRGHLSVLYACGPFTFGQTLTYKPLELLVQ